MEEHEKANEDHDADVPFSGDSAASLGIHQWAMPKHTAGAGGSLVEFFKTLHSRAKDAEAKKAEDRSEEEAIWKTWRSHPVKKARKGKRRYDWKSRSERLASSEAGT